MTAVLKGLPAWGTAQTSVRRAIPLRIRRLTEFATDAAHLADARLDLDLRRLVDNLHRDLIELEEKR